MNLQVLNLVVVYYRVCYGDVVHEIMGAANCSNRMEHLAGAVGGLKVRDVFFLHIDSVHQKVCLAAYLEYQRVGIEPVAHRYACRAGSYFPVHQHRISSTRINIQSVEKR